MIYKGTKRANLKIEYISFDILTVLPVKSWQNRLNYIEVSAEKDGPIYPIYNIAGQRTNDTQKGILIKGGKKIVNK